MPGGAYIYIEGSLIIESKSEVWVDNPLCSTDRHSFWSTTLDPEIVKQPDYAFLLVEKIKEL